jgi:hypothetical protein
MSWGLYSHIFVISMVMLPFFRFGYKSYKFHNRPENRHIRKTAPSTKIIKNP